VRGWTHVGVTLAAVGLLSACESPDARPRGFPNEPPFGTLEQPGDGEIVGRVTDVSGWALDDSSVVRVELIVDGRTQASARPSLPRPDVSRALLRFARSGHRYGWSMTADLGEQGGTHQIDVVAIDDEGKSARIGTRHVTVISR
jgi:hypothetical protein